MRNLSLVVAARSGVGRGVSKRLRASGKIPAVIYGHSGTQPLEVEEKAFKSLLMQKGKSAALVEVTIGSNAALLSDIVDIQKDPLTDKVLHIDFHEVLRTEKMMTSVPFEFIGESIGVKNNGGVLDIARREVTIKCLPADLPECIQVDVSGLDIGSIVHFSDLKLPSGIDIVGDADTPVVSCKDVTEEEPTPAAASATATETTTAAAGSAPEQTAIDTAATADKAKAPAKS